MFFKPDLPEVPKDHAVIWYDPNTRRKGGGVARYTKAVAEAVARELHSRDPRLEYAAIKLERADCQIVEVEWGNRAPYRVMILTEGVIQELNTQDLMQRIRQCQILSVEDEWSKIQQLARDAQSPFDQALF
jgi:hypothetical protein